MTIGVGIGFFFLLEVNAINAVVSIGTTNIPIAVGLVLVNHKISLSPSSNLASI